MRGLSRSEVAVLGALLPSVPGGERDRIGFARVPRTTYQSIRQRAFRAGWLEERFVPTPASVGARAVAIALGQPYAERRREILDGLSADPDTVLLWASSDTVLAVTYERATGSQVDPEGSEAREDRDPAWRRSCRVRVAGPGSGLPAFFDLEGAWSLSVMDRHPVSYPLGLPFAGAEGNRRRLWDPGQNELHELLSRPFADEDDGRLGPLGRIRIVRRGRRLLASGRVQRRLFLSLGALPPVSDRPIERIVFVTGECRPGTEPGGLLGELVRRARVAPFLFGFDPERILLAGLSPGGSRRADPDVHVLPILQRFMSRIEVIREPIGSLRPILEHRYDRLAIPRTVPSLRPRAEGRSSAPRPVERGERSVPGP